MNGGQIALKTLKKYGIQYLVGYTGGAIMPFFDEMVKEKDIKFIMSRHEQGAAFICQGISRGSYHHQKQQLGTCITTSGPGAMNLVTGIADAFMDSVPVLAITGQVATSVIGTDAFQESDVVGVMLPITKHASMVTHFNEIEASLMDAINLAVTGRMGPVNVDLPKNIQMQSAGTDYSPKNPHYTYKQQQISKTQVRKAIDLLNKAERPVIFCGHGVKASNSGAMLLKLAETANVPVAFTLHGLSAFPVSHKVSLGMMGMHGTVEANRAIENADLIFAFGMRFDDRVTGKLSEYAKNATVVHVEIDPSEINKNVKAELAINGDVKAFLNMVFEIGAVEAKAREKWWQKIANFRNELTPDLKAEVEKGKGAEGKILMKTCVSKLSEVTKGQAFIVTDVGVHQMITARYYDYQKTNSFYTSGGAGTMGAGLPMSIGVKLVNPEESVWCVSGDGGFQMNIQELGTLMQYKIPVKIMLLNNGYLGMVRQWQTLFFDGRYAGTPMQNPDYGQIASAYGLDYRKVTKLEDVSPALEQAEKSKNSVIVEIICDPTEIVLPMIPTGASFSEMITKVTK